MRERPILFSGPMVAAILAGRKTQTRRILKEQPGPHCKRVGIDEGTFCEVHGYGPDGLDGSSTEGTPRHHCPYGQPGDWLWVRETWGLNYREGYRIDPCVTYRADSGQRLIDPMLIPAEFTPKTGEWRPSIFMPRWASRLTLEVTVVRVERLQDISEEDAISEGMTEGAGGYYSFTGEGLGEWESSAREAFEVGWDTINGKRAPWASNPFVWVVTFKRADQAEAS